eukprot:10422575-Prorocentrum_lima.AAC.1
MTSSLVGSEMCIRDSAYPADYPPTHQRLRSNPKHQPCAACRSKKSREYTVSYTHLTLPTICSV